MERQEISSGVGNCKTFEDDDACNIHINIESLEGFLVGAKKLGATHVDVSGGCESDGSGLYEVSFQPITIKTESDEAFNIRMKVERDLLYNRNKMFEKIDRRTFEELKLKYNWI